MHTVILSQICMKCLQIIVCRGIKGLFKISMFVNDAPILWILCCADIGNFLCMFIIMNSAFVQHSNFWETGKKFVVPQAALSEGRHAPPVSPPAAVICTTCQSAPLGLVWRRTNDEEPFTWEAWSHFKLGGAMPPNKREEKTGFVTPSHPHSPAPFSSSSSSSLSLLLCSSSSSSSFSFSSFNAAFQAHPLRLLSLLRVSSSSGGGFDDNSILLLLAA